MRIHDGSANGRAGVRSGAGRRHASIAHSHSVVGTRHLGRARPGPRGRQSCGRRTDSAAASGGRHSLTNGERSDSHGQAGAGTVGDGSAGGFPTMEPGDCLDRGIHLQTPRVLNPLSAGMDPEPSGSIRHFRHLPSDGSPVRPALQRLPRRTYGRATSRWAGGSANHRNERFADSIRHLVSDRGQIGRDTSGASVQRDLVEAARRGDLEAFEVLRALPATGSTRSPDLSFGTHTKPRTPSRKRSCAPGARFRGCVTRSGGTGGCTDSSSMHARMKVGGDADCRPRFG